MSGEFISETSQWYLMTAINSLCYCVKSNLIVFDCALGGSHKRILFGYIYLCTIRTINRFICMVYTYIYVLYGEKLLESHHSHVSFYCYIYIYVYSTFCIHFLNGNSNIHYS